MYLSFCYNLFSQLFFCILSLLALLICLQVVHCVKFKKKMRQNVCLNLNAAVQENLRAKMCLNVQCRVLLHCSVAVQENLRAKICLKCAMPRRVALQRGSTREYARENAKPSA